MAGPDAVFAAYLRSVWLVQAACQCYGGSTVGGFFARSNALLLALVLLTAATTSRPLFVAATLARLALRLAAMPFIWEVEVWAALMDLTLLAARCDVRRAAGAIRAQMIIFYAGAAFWKINTSFLEARTSCGTIFFAQLIAAYAPAPLVESPTVAGLLRAGAPAAALATEIAVPVLLLAWRNAGLGLALLFHLLVVLTPPPNNAGGFSVCAAQYLFFFAPDAAAATLTELRAGRTLWLAAAAGAAVATGCYVGAHPYFFDTAPAAYALQFALLTHCVTLPVAPPPPVRRSAAPIGAALPLCVALLYAFGLPTLGVLDQMAPNMFSNQRFHGGSNHLLVPTGLVHRVLGEAAFGVVRVQNTTSALIGAQYPAEVSASLSPGARRLLKAAGHSGRQWNPMLGRVIGLQAVAGPADEDAGKPAAQYTLPAMELRRLIGEAQAAGESFEVEYARLDGLTAPRHAEAEAWRVLSAGRTAVYQWDATTRTASCFAGRGPLAPTCPSDDPAMLPPPPKWALKLAAFQPLPILTGERWEEVHCYGP